MLGNCRLGLEGAQQICFLVERFNCYFQGYSIVENIPLTRQSAPDVKKVIAPFLCSCCPSLLPIQEFVEPCDEPEPDFLLKLDPFCWVRFVYMYLFPLRVHKHVAV